MTGIASPELTDAKVLSQSPLARLCGLSEKIIVVELQASDIFLLH
ncbi:MAG: hypothetical protein WCI11_14220 [Candidatus Methylumidiphilus sp.]|nr:hypothetical protein [Pseudomonadota bacterium]